MSDAPRLTSDLPTLEAVLLSSIQPVIATSAPRRQALQ